MATCEISKLVGKNIQTLRNNARLKQETLAEILGIQRTLLSQIENGHRLPYAELLERISAYFELPVFKLFIPDSWKLRLQYIEDCENRGVFKLLHNDLDYSTIHKHHKK